MHEKSILGEMIYPISWRSDIGVLKSYISISSGFTAGANSAADEGFALAVRCFPLGCGEAF